MIALSCAANICAAISFIVTSADVPAESSIFIAADSVILSERLCGSFIYSLMASTFDCIASLYATVLLSITCESSSPYFLPSFMIFSYMLCVIRSSISVSFFTFSLTIGDANVVTAIVIIIATSDAAILIAPFFIPLKAAIHKIAATHISTISSPVKYYKITIIFNIIHYPSLSHSRHYLLSKL